MWVCWYHRCGIIFQHWLYDPLLPGCVVCGHNRSRLKSCKYHLLFGIRACLCVFLSADGKSVDWRQRERMLNWLHFCTHAGSHVCVCVCVVFLFQWLLLHMWVRFCVTNCRCLTEYFSYPDDDWNIQYEHWQKLRKPSFFMHVCVVALHLYVQTVTRLFMLAVCVVDVTCCSLPWLW